MKTQQQRPAPEPVVLPMHARLRFLLLPFSLAITLFDLTAHQQKKRGKV
jgi:hypothetical protein